jgi:hypothetical protein
MNKLKNFLNRAYVNGTLHVLNLDFIRETQICAKFRRNAGESLQSNSFGVESLGS